MTSVTRSEGSQKVEPQDPVGLIQSKLKGTWMTAARSRLEKQWLRCVAYAKGIQDERNAMSLSALSRDGARLRRKHLNRDYFISNQIKPYIKRRLAQLVSAPPGWECSSAPTDV